MTAVDEREFDEFVSTRYARLCRTAFVLCGDWGYAEDLVQVTVDNLDAYTRRALVNTSSTWWRSRWRGEIPTERVPDTAAPGSYEQIDMRAALVSALATLPVQQRAVIALRYFDELSEAETAAALGCSLGTVKSRTARALTRLRACGFPDDIEDEAGLSDPCGGTR